MATPKRLNFSSSGSGDSDTRLQKHATEEEEPMMKMKTTTNKKKQKKKKLVIKRIWNEDNELAILKGLVDYRVRTRNDPNFDWDGFYSFIKDSINANVSKEQLLSKMRKLKRRFAVHMERITQGNDPLFTRCTDSQAFGYAKMIWDNNEDEVANGSIMKKANQNENGESAFQENGQVANDEHANENGKSLPEAEKAHQTENGEYALNENEQVANDEPVNENGKSLPEAVGMEKAQQTENGESAFQENGQVGNDEPVNENGKSLPEEVCTEKAQQTENGECAFKENGQASNDEPVNENGAEKNKFDGKSLPEAVGVDKTTEYKTDGKENHDDDDDDADDFCAVQDAFETVMLQGSSSYQKKLQVEKLMNIGTRKRKELSIEWKALCAEQVKLNIKKLRFSAKLAEAASGELK